MGHQDFEAEVERIATLIHDRRYETALALTDELRRRLADVPGGAGSRASVLRDLVEASRLLAASLIALRAQQVH
jgi:hypothetical protein